MATIAMVAAVTRAMTFPPGSRVAPDRVGENLALPMENCAPRSA